MRERFRLVLSPAILLLLVVILAACTGSQTQVTTPIQQSVATPGAQAATPVVEVVATPEPLIPTLLPAQAIRLHSIWIDAELASSDADPFASSDTNSASQPRLDAPELSAAETPTEIHSSSPLSLFTSLR